MGFSFIPDYQFKYITDIKPAFLKNLGVKFLMLDIDNTIAAYNEPLPSDEIRNWIIDLKNNNITPALISNSSRIMRVHSFAELFEIRSVARAKKPSILNLLHLIKESGFEISESSLIGDQIITDVLAANRAGIISIIIKPRKLTNIIFLIRYFMEQPFRFFSKNKSVTL